MAERIKVIFKRVLVLNDADWLGSGEFFFKARVDGSDVGDPSAIFEANENQWINLPAGRWFKVVPVRDKPEVRVSFEGWDEDTFWNDQLGKVEHVLRPPYAERTFRHSTEYFTLEWGVELEVEGAFGHHPPTAIFAARANNGGMNLTTVSGAAIVARMEFCPVRPTPPAANLPPRPVFPVGTPGAQENTGNVPTINPGDPINIVPNPAVIPLLAAAAADANTAARIEYTYYRPSTLNFTDDDPRLEWTAVALSGGAAVAFVGPARGRKVLVYGTAAGEVRLECRFRGELFAQYRALVGAVKQIPCRFNILNGPTAASRPRATPANIRDHLAIANRFLRQIGVELVLDTNATTKDGASATSIPGIFRIPCMPGTTRNVASVGFMKATKFNYRPGVMNFAYIHSDSGGNLGAADAYPASGAGATITDSGSPSASWNVPSGVLPDAAAAAVTMTLLAARLRPGHPNLTSMYITDGPNGDPSTLAGMQTYAGTIAHEFGHNLNLAHRVDTGGSPFNDNVNHPPNENVMHWNNPTSLAQDFDIIQAKAARQSPLIPP
jgi:hypothetical protein